MYGAVRKQSLIVSYQLWFSVVSTLYLYDIAYIASGRQYNLYLIFHSKFQLKDGGCFDLNPETNSEDLIMDWGRGETDEDEITVHGEANEFHSKANVSIPSVQ